MASGWPVDVKDGLDALGQGFNNRPQGQRSALTLVNGKLYVPYAGHYGDCGTYNGMVVGLDLATARVFGFWSTEITGGGSWGQSGVAFDGTSMFVTTGNTFSSSNSSWGGGEAVIRLPPTLKNPTQDADFFAPANWQTLDAEDPISAGLQRFRSTPRSLPACSRWARMATPICLIARISEGSATQIADDSGVDHPDPHRDGDLPRADAARVAFEGQGAACPSGQSGNLVMLKITPSAIATAWCASFNGGGAPIVTTTDGKTDPIVWVVGAQGDGKLYGFRGTDGKLTGGRRRRRRSDRAIPDHSACQRPLLCGRQRGGLRLRLLEPQAAASRYSSQPGGAIERVGGMQVRALYAAGF